MSEKSIGGASARGEWKHFGKVVVWSRKNG